MELAVPSRKSPGDPEYQRALDEYKEVGTNFRHYSDLRFKQLGLFGAIATVIVAAYASDRVPDAVRRVAPLAGLLATVCFYALDVRANAYRVRYVHIARRLEDVLGFSAYNDTRLHWTWYTLAVYTVLYLMMGILWVLAVIMGPMPPQ